MDITFPSLDVPGATAWTPTLAAVGGTTVAFTGVGGGYVVLGKLTIFQASFTVTYAVAPTAVDLTFPLGKSAALAGGAIANNVFSLQTLYAAFSAGSSTMNIRGTGGGAIVTASGQSIFVSGFILTP